MHVQVPPEITDQVLEFAHKMIGPNAEPQYVEVTPERGCEPVDCFKNVQRKVIREGGRIQFGWAVWEWHGVFIEGEHHAVYAPPSGSQLIDITPCPMGTKRRMFVPDDSATYNFENEGILRDNRRYSLVDDPLVDELFKAAAKRTALKNELPGVGSIVIHASEDQKLQKLERRVDRALCALAEKYVPELQRR